MPRQPRGKDQEKQESGLDDGYQQSVNPSQSQSQSQSPSPTPSTNPAPLNPSAPLEEPLPKRVKRSSTPKAKKTTATTTTPSTPKTPATSRVMITRARVTKQKGEATSAKAEGKGGEIVQFDDGGTESDVDIELVKTPTSKSPRARTKVAGTKGGAKVQMARNVESGSDIKPTVKTSTPKKPRAKPKGRAIGDSPDGDAVNDGDNKLVKTPMPKKPRVSKLEGGGGAGAGRAKTPTMPRKPSASQSKRITKMSPEDPFTTKLPLFSPIHGGNADDAQCSSPEGIPSKVSPPRGSLMDGIETDKYVAATAMLELMTSNRDCEMMAMPQQERNGRGYQHRQAYDAPFPRSPTALPEVSTLDTLDETDPDTAKATGVRTVFSPILNNQFLTPPAVQKDRQQSRSTDFAIKYLPSLPAKTTELHMPAHFASRSSSAPAETRWMSSQPPMTASRSFGLKLNLSTLQPWLNATVRQPMSSMPSFLRETSKSYAAATTSAITTTTTTPLALSPPESVYSLAMAVDAAYIKASSHLTQAMSLTKSSLEEQADVIRYHAVAQRVFDQGLRMTEPQWRTLFPHEQGDDQTATSAQFPSPPSLFHAACATPLTVMLTPNIQENLGKQPGESFKTPTRPPDQASTSTRSSSRSSFSPFFVSSRPLSPTSPSPPSTPSRSPMMVPLVTARGDNGDAGPVQLAPSMGFENESVQSSIFAHNRQGYTAPTPPPPLQQQSCAATSFDTVISATTDRSNIIKALLPAKLKAKRENEQQLRQSDHNCGPQSQQHGMPPGQHQQYCLAAPLFATPNAQLQVHNQQQRNHRQQQEAEMEHLKASTATTRKEKQKGKLTSSEEVGGAVDWMTSQLSEAQWNRVKERSTELYHKATKSFEISAEAHCVSQESHFQYDELVRHWKVLSNARKD